MYYETVEMASSNRIVLACLVLVCVGSGVGFAFIFLSGPFPTTTNTNSTTTTTTPTSTDSTTPIEHTLEWGVSVGDTLVYNFSEDVYEYQYDGTYDLGQVNLTITSLPDIPVVMTHNSFFTDIFGKIQFDCIYSNGSEINPQVYPNEDLYLYYASRAILPIGDWEFLDSLFIDYDEVSITTVYSADIYYGEVSGEYFIFGYVGYDMDADTGMRFTYNSTNGISTGFYDFIDHDWAMYRTSGTLIAYNPQ